MRARGLNVTVRLVTPEKKGNEVGLFHGVLVDRDAEYLS